MKIVVNITGGGKFNVELTFQCVTCGSYCQPREVDELKHPVYKEKLLGGENKNKPINCPYAGKVFQHPFVMELKEK